MSRLSPLSHPQWKPAEAAIHKFRGSKGSPVDDENRKCRRMVWLFKFCGAVVFVLVCLKIGGF